MIRISPKFTAFFSLLLLVGGSILPAMAEITNASATTQFPIPDWTIAPIESDAAIVARKHLEAIAFPEKNQNPGKPPVITDSLIVVKDGVIRYERYANGYGPDQRHITWSVSKSITNLLLGLAIQDGKVKLEDSICKYLDVQKKEQCGIQIQHIAQHSSGLNWVESYEESEKPTESAVLAMLYGSGMRDVARFVLDRHDLEAKPGTRWRYSSGDSNLLAAALQSAYGVDYFAKVPKQRIFAKLGIKSALWEQDANGVPIGSSYLYMSPRDMARYGLLFLANGKWGEEKIIDPEWIQYSTTLGPAIANSPGWKSRDGRIPETYGAHWWLNKAHPQSPEQKPWPDLPDDGYAAMGHWGQYIFILPSHNIVVVRTGNDRGPRMDLNALLKNAVEMLENE